MTSDWHGYAAELRAARERLQNLHVDDPALPVCIAGLGRIEAMLRRPLRIAVLGEHNSGKTSLTDLILGRGLLPISVIANTNVPVMVSHGAEPALYGVNDDGVQIRIDGEEDDALTDLHYRAIEIRLPIPFLKENTLLDTPAEQPPAAFAAEADISIWCTVATRSWTESERNLWSTVPSRCFTHALLVATHKDSFFSDDDCAQVLRRLKSMSRGQFRDVLLISTVDPDEEASGDSGEEPSSSDAALLRAGLEASIAAIRQRRLAKARRITRRLARLTAHEFGQGAIRPEAAPAMAAWDATTSELLREHRMGRLASSRTIEAILYAFAEAAEALRPGAIRHTASTKISTPMGNSSRAAPRPATVASDLTAVLRILATYSRYEAPDAREQREAARATLFSLAGLDKSFVDLEHWLKSTAAEAPLRQQHIA